MKNESASAKKVAMTYAENLKGYIRAELKGIEEEKVINELVANAAANFMLFALRSDMQAAARLQTLFADNFSEEQIEELNDIINEYADVSGHSQDDDTQSQRAKAKEEAKQQAQYAKDQESANRRRADKERKEKAKADKERRAKESWDAMKHFSTKGYTIVGLDSVSADDIFFFEDTREAFRVSDVSAKNVYILSYIDGQHNPICYNVARSFFNTGMYVDDRTGEERPFNFYRKAV